MLSIKFVAAVGLLLVGAPVSDSFADDEQTQTLHTKTYQESVLTVCGQLECVAQFPKTQRINPVVTAISCNHGVPVGGQTLLAQLFTSNEALTRFNVSPFISGTADYPWFVGLNAQVNLFVKQGGLPRFYIETTLPSTSMTCTISVYHS